MCLDHFTCSSVLVGRVLIGQHDVVGGGGGVNRPNTILCAKDNHSVVSVASIRFLCKYRRRRDRSETNRLLLLFVVLLLTRADPGANRSPSVQLSVLLLSEQAILSAHNLINAVQPQMSTMCTHTVGGRKAKKCLRCAMPAYLLLATTCTLTPPHNSMLGQNEPGLDWNRQTRRQNTKSPRRLSLGTRLSTS